MPAVRLHLVSGSVDAKEPFDQLLDAVGFEGRCLDRWADSLVARSFSQRTIDGAVPTLERFLERCGQPVWAVSRDDIDRVMLDLANAGLAPSTRMGYLQVFKNFHSFVLARHGSEIERRFGVVMDEPVDAFNSARHVANGAEASRPPPSVARLEEFFGYLRDQIATARKFGTAGRDYALFRTLYHAGIRSDEAARLDVADIHLDRGPFGKAHVRFGKGTRTSGPRARWVPLLDGLDLILGWYLAEVRPRFGPGAALFCDEGGGAIHRGTVGNRLRQILAAEGAGPEGHFSPHGLRHACATHNYERGVDLVAIQQLLGHWQIGTTMRYVTPSSTFIEDAYRRALSVNLSELEKGDG
ncbi:MAG TPA: tyrosine-type recombinase/integrase [Acidimicrobiales bacterium]